jgi:hypothetical protein
MGYKHPELISGLIGSSLWEKWCIVTDNGENIRKAVKYICKIAPKKERRLAV